MNAVDRLRCRLQVALLIEAHKGAGDIPNIVDLARRYSVQGEPALIQSSVRDWEARGLLTVSRTLDGDVYAAVRRDALADATSLTLDLIDASFLKVNHSKEEIFTDAAEVELIPVPEDWKLFQAERDHPSRIEPSSSKQHGIHITNTFSPVNQVHTSHEREAKRSDLAGWTNVVIAVLIGLATILVTLWIAGKL